MAVASPFLPHLGLKFHSQLMGIAARRSQRDEGGSWRCLASAPALRERRHRSFTRQLVTVRRTPVVAVVAAGPHPGTILRRNGHLEDAADSDAILQHVIVVLVPANRRALEDQRGHHGGGGGGGGRGGRGGGGFGGLAARIIAPLADDCSVACARG
jgi:hypothetical protein